MIKTIPISLFSEQDAVLEVYEGFSSFKECEARLAAYNFEAPMDNTSFFHKLHLAIYNFYIVILENGFYLVGYSEDGKAVVSGKNTLFYKMDGWWHTLDLTGCDEYGRKNGIPYAALPYHITSCCKEVYPLDTLTKAIRPYAKFLVMRHSTQEDCDEESTELESWMGTTILNEPAIGHTVARILFSTMIKTLFPLAGTDFSRYFTKEEVACIETLPLSDFRICNVNPFLCEVQYLNGIVEKKPIFSAQMNQLSTPRNITGKRTFQELKSRPRRNNVIAFSKTT